MFKLLTSPSFSLASCINSFPSCSWLWRSVSISPDSRQPTGNLDDPWKCSNCWSLGLCCHTGLSRNAYTKRLALCQSATKSLGRLSGLRWKERLLCSNLSSSPFSLTKQQQQSTLTLDLDHLGGDNGPFVMSFGDSCAKLPKNRETQFPKNRWRACCFGKGHVVARMAATTICPYATDWYKGNKTWTTFWKQKMHLWDTTSWPLAKQKLSPPKGIPTSVQNLPQQMGCSSPAPQKARNAPAMNLVQSLGTSF